MITNISMIQNSKISEERKHSWVDIITKCGDKIPYYKEKIRKFHEEHLYLDENICCILDDSGYFDESNKEIKCIWIPIEAGEMISLPVDLYHHFIIDGKSYVKAMLVFVGKPVWMV
ncbi:1,2-dihydroxy-3-keto-5-methylthiopentene dioxygenase [Fukomys damarensis]|uniref:acireductone dioxygenase (Fe(2+)-requiring) n=1 Tax=Fukomys damarensis TaxID=885580 RepID=A0A091DQS0_FUKDA|nr:1,2-dihydroxy-3-keto-5-methylthiopentene dioxygenase [Fukomys damarensis]